MRLARGYPPGTFVMTAKPAHEPDNKPAHQSNLFKIGHKPWVGRPCNNR